MLRMEQIFLTDNEQMRALDRYSIESLGLPGLVLMESAGRSVAEVLLEGLEGDLDQQVLVLAGPGNNGGDGFVVARWLQQRGLDVVVLLLSDPETLRGDASLNHRAYVACGGVVEVATTLDQAEPQLELFESASIIIDAIFGTGLHGTMPTLEQWCIDLANQSGAMRCAVDMPSGLSGDGEVCGRPFQADLTVTFGAAKLGCFSPTGEECCGDIVVADIGLPTAAYEHVDLRRMVADRFLFQDTLPPRPSEGHKGIFGHVLVVAGSPGKSGAARLAGRAALTSGAGLVTLGLVEDLFPLLAAGLDELMAVRLPTRDGVLGDEGLSLLLELATNRDALVLGPGLPLDDRSVAGLLLLFEHLEVPLILDAEALNLTARHPELLVPLRGKPVILTPHPGEFARLLGLGPDEVQADRIRLCEAFSARHGVHLILKGHHSVVCAPDGRTVVNTTGNPGMATAGMGDVLSGLLGTLCSQLPDPHAAAGLGVFIHGWAGALAAEELGQAGVTASDVIARLGEALEVMQHGECEDHEH